MAGPPCMSQDGNQAVFVGTMLQTGDAVALCDECLVPWAAAVLQAMTGVDPAPFIAAISEPDTVPGTQNGAPTDEPPQPAPADEDSEAVPLTTGRTPGRPASKRRGAGPSASDE